MRSFNIQKYNPGFQRRHIQVSFIHISLKIMHTKLSIFKQRKNSILVATATIVLKNILGNQTKQYGKTIVYYHQKRKKKQSS